MSKSRLQYIMTWISLFVLLLSGLGLMALSWNGAILEDPNPSLLVFHWVLISASGIYLFFLAVKKAHRVWLTEERHKRIQTSDKGKKGREGSSSKKDLNKLEAAVSAEKMVRRAPSGHGLEEIAGDLIKVVSRELELMTGILYIKKGRDFRAVSSFAAGTGEEIKSFREGEGLNGQVAKNKQIQILKELPAGYLEVYSGLGKAAPDYLALVPLLHEDKCVALLECAGYRYDPKDIESTLRIFAGNLMNKIYSKE